MNKLNQRRKSLDDELRDEVLKAVTRRQLFGRCMTGVGVAALSSLMGERSWGSAPGDAKPPTQDVAGPLAPKAPHFAGKAKNIIYLHMAGAPSQLDLFDDKPLLTQYNGKPVPAELTKGERFAFIKGTPKVLGSPYKFARHGKTGTAMSELLPHLATVADELAVVRSMHTDQFNHAPAQLFVQTGSQFQGKPSMGSWLTYGLGSKNRDLPGFVVLLSGPNNPDGGSALWSSGFLPGVYQGTPFRAKGDPVLFVSNPKGVSTEIRRRSLDAIRDLNSAQLGHNVDPEIATRIEQYELAYRMQTTVPELMDIAKEPAEVHEMYGTQPGQVSFANNCLLARRLVERGVRFVQLYDWGWDNHGENPNNDLMKGLPRKCRETDRPAAALIKDLKRRGLLDSTLVVWGGEFGRTPMNEGRGGSPYLGRDHHPKAFTIWMAGGGIKGGLNYGSTDDFGYNVVADPMHVHDLQATILHAAGIDPHKFSFPYQGLNQRLIGPADDPKVHSALFA